jgi:hypothetical protein
MYFVSELVFASSLAFVAAPNNRIKRENAIRPWRRAARHDLIVNGVIVD